MYLAPSIIRPTRSYNVAIYVLNALILPTCLLRHVLYPVLTSLMVVFLLCFTAHKSKAYQLCCSGGYTDDDKDTVPEEPAAAAVTSPSKSKPLPPIATNGDAKTSTSPSKPQSQSELTAEGIQLPWLNHFLGTQFANFILKVPVKIGIVLVYFGLVAGAVYGVYTLEEGLDRASLAPDSSYFIDYFRDYTRDFSSNYGVNVMVAIDNTLDYTEQSTRDDIDELLQEFKDNKYFVSSEEFVISWLSRYVDYLTNQRVPSTDVNTLDMPEFIDILQDEFFAIEGYKYHQVDVVISSDNTSITASRYFMQTKALDDAIAERTAMTDARDLADDSKFDVVVFTPSFIFFDQYTVILQNTLQNLGIAVGCMMVVSLILIPSLTTVVLVTLATVSICSCVVGYMSLWDVNLDSVSMINLVMCIGFSVDFAAHISYHYVASTSTNPADCTRDALGYLGTPIVQGAVSTILAVSVLGTSDTYIFRTFFKLVFLVMVLGFFHAMFLLPVLLSTLNCSQRCKRSKEVGSGNEQEMSNGHHHSNPAYEIT